MTSDRLIPARAKDRHRSSTTASDLAASPSGTVNRSNGMPGSTSTPIPAWVTTAARAAPGTGCGHRPGQQVADAVPHRHVVAPVPQLDRDRAHGRPSGPSPVAGQDLGHHLVGGQVVDVDHHVGDRLVEGPPHPVQVDQRRGRVVTEQRTTLAVPDPIGQHHGVGPEPHHPARPGQQGPVGRGQHHPTGSRHHHRSVTGQGLGQDPLLLGPEGRLTLLGEELGHACARYRP